MVVLSNHPKEVLAEAKRSACSMPHPSADVRYGMHTSLAKGIATTGLRSCRAPQNSVLAAFQVMNFQHSYSTM